MQSTIEQPTTSARGLAYVGKVVELHAIPNADRIESAVVVCGVGGRWTGVVRKGEFLIGELCTVLLQDAIVPESDRWPFLKSCGWRIRMTRFRGVPSECVIVRGCPVVPVGTDLTSALGITKYQKPIPAKIAGDPIGPFPSFIPKTDEPNFQRVPELVEALLGTPYIVTEKLDGSSGTAFKWNGEFGVCSRNLQLKEGDNAYWNVANLYCLRDKLPDGYAIQFEVCGPGIQGNPLGLKSVDGFAFNVYSIAEREYLPHGEFERFLCKFEMPSVPIVTTGMRFGLDDDGMRALAEGKYRSGKNREGIVIRSLDSRRVSGQRLSFKVINLLYE